VRHLERVVHVAASPAEVFMRLDSQTRAQVEDTVVTERAYARRKAWKSDGATPFPVINRYTMGYEVAPEGGGTRLKVWMDFAPTTRLLGALVAPIYARWRVDDLAQDAADSFTDMAAAVIAHP
jgi:hypothetical protein